MRTPVQTSPTTLLNFANGSADRPRVLRAAEKPRPRRLDYEASRRRCVIGPLFRSALRGAEGAGALRIAVDDVLSYLAAGMTEDEILSDLPDLER